MPPEVVPRTYLRPLLDPADRAGLGRWPLAGGPLSFSAVERLTRTDGGVRSEIVEPRGDDLARLIRRRSHPTGLRGEPPFIAGILNVTPDSFSDGGRSYDPEHAVAHGLAMIEAGADLIDIGGESTRPGADAVPEGVEIDRVVPVIRALAGSGMPLSIDTRKAGVMEAAIAAGAGIVNDVSALAFDPQAAAVVAAAGVTAGGGGSSQDAASGTRRRKKPRSRSATPPGASSPSAGTSGAPCSSRLPSRRGRALWL